MIGGGGHCKSILDCILVSGQYDTIGIVDSKETSVLDIAVVGTDEDLPLLFKDGWKEAFIAVGSIGNTTLRRKLFNLVKEQGFLVPSIISSSAVIARDVMIGEGSFIGKNCIVNTSSHIGCCAIINSGAIIEHDCMIGDFVHISPGAVLCGQVMVGDDSHIGAGAVVKQQIVIGDHVIVGAGGVVVNSLPGFVTAYGNPCKVIDR